MVVCVDIPLIFFCISCLVVDNIVLDFVSEQSNYPKKHHFLLFSL